MSGDYRTTRRGEMLSSNSETVKSFHESFYGTPNEEAGRSSRRRGKRRHQSQPKEEPQNEVAVIGTHYRSFDDDSMAAFINSATALVPWNGDAKLLIDRYDVRHLLQDLTGVRRRRARPPSPDATKEELDYERYRDMELLENPSSLEDVELRNGNTGEYQTVGLDYPVGGDDSSHKERVAEAIFSPPFFVPEHLRANLPTSIKVHQIMAGTAKYVYEHGGQAEIVLRVKQANNPMFGFLMPDHYHHGYFRFLVDHPEHTGIGTSTQQVAEVAVDASSEETEGGLSLLGTAYGDADEDDEDERETVDVEVYDDTTMEPLVVPAGDISETGTLLAKEESDSNVNNGSTLQRSPKKTQNTKCGEDCATLDTRDSREPDIDPGNPMSTSDHEPAGEVPIDGKIYLESNLQELTLPGMEAGSSNATSEDLDHQVFPQKVPPVQLRRIIDKMVEFISRNGKEFEAIVKERDKSDHRFTFFLPGNEYHPYYSRALDAARQALASSETAVSGVPLGSESQTVSSEEDQARDNFLNGVPYWVESWTTGLHDRNGELAVSETHDGKTEKSQMEGGMDLDAVLAAVRAATRGNAKAVEENEAADQLKAPDASERPEMGSDEAVLAAIRAATGRSKPDPLGSVRKGESSLIAGSGGTPIGSPGNLIKTTSGVESDGGCKPTNSPPLSNSDALGIVDKDNVVVVAKAAALAVGEEGDSVDAQLAPPEKRKAERLKKAKLFAAMIKDRSGTLANVGLGSGSFGVAAVPSVERLNQAAMPGESSQAQPGDDGATPFPAMEPGKRYEAPEALVQVAGEGETVQAGDNSLKERKRKVVSKEREEKHRKHHHKRTKDAKGSETKQVHNARETKPVKHYDGDQDIEPRDWKHDAIDGKTDDKFSERVQIEENRDERSHHTHTSEARRAGSKLKHYSKQSKSGRRHEEVLEDMGKAGSRGLESEERSERRHDHERAEKRKNERHSDDSEEARSRSRHKHDRESRKEKSRKSSAKKKKLVDTADERADERAANEHRSREHSWHISKESKHRSSDLHRSDERTRDRKESKYQQDPKHDRNKRSVPEEKQELPRQPALEARIVVEEKAVQPPIDVPEDIRAKVRAILAMT